MPHPLYLMSNKRRSADLRAKYGYFRHIWLAERSGAATGISQRPALLMAPWPSGILQSLSLGLDCVLRVVELVLCSLRRIGMEIASACREDLDDQSTPLCLSYLLSAARLRRGPQDSLGLLAKTCASGSRCARHRCRSSWRSRRGGPGSETAWDGRNHAADGLPSQSWPSVRQGRAAPCSVPVGRGAVCRTARAPGLWSSRSVSGKRCVRDPCVTALRDAFRT